MTQNPRLKACYRPFYADEETTLLLSERGHKVLTGVLYAKILPLLDGNRGADEVVAQLAPHAGAAEVYYTLDLLAQKGYLTTDRPDLAESKAAFWHALGSDAEAANRRIAGQPVNLMAVGNVSPVPFERALAWQSIDLTCAEGFPLVLTDDYLREPLAEKNRAFLRDSRSWLLVKPVGTQLWLGPLFQPGKTGCWQCLAQRLGAHRQLERWLERENGGRPEPPSPGAIPASEAAAANLAAVEIALWLGGGTTSLSGTVVTLDFLTFEARRHQLVARPQCPECGDPRYRDILPRERPELGACRKRFTDDGGHRHLSPGQTLARYRHHISPITGIVHRLVHIEGPSEGLLHRVDSGPNPARQPATFKGLRQHLRESGGGKGKTREQAMAGGLCEAIERYSAVYQGYEPRILASFRELGNAAVHPNRCMGFSPAQYGGRYRHLAAANPHHRVPQPFDENRSLAWAPVWPVRGNEPKYLPLQLCYEGYSEDPPYCIPTSNGTAAGNTLEEAVLQGLLELVERDAVAVWWYNRIARPPICLASFQDPFLARMEGHFRDMECDLWVLDLTSDLGIPCFAAVSHDRGRDAIALGFGAHLEARIAVSRAVTEAGQAMPGPRNQSPSGHLEPGGGRYHASPGMHRLSRENQAFLFPSGRPTTSEDYPYRRSDDLLEDIYMLTDRLERAGMETLVLDMTRPDIGLPVVRVFVPGLRHFWPRFAAGRLYDVPVQMGWLTSPLTEDRLNPQAIF